MYIQITVCLDGCCRMDRLMDRAVELGMSAMAPPTMGIYSVQFRL